MESEQEQFALLPSSVRWPVELNPPPRFDPADPATWPALVGRIEFVDGRLLYMPPCGEEQSVVVAELARIFGNWRARRPEFDVAASEPGVHLGGDVRAPDVGIWRKPPQPSARTRAYRTTPPVLAVEVAGADDADSEHALRTKAQWYFAHGVPLLWLVLPKTRELVVLRPQAEARLSENDAVPEAAELPGLTLRVADVFASL